jgi:predicted aspartyl protease
VPRSPETGEAPIEPRGIRKIVLVRNVTLAAPTTEQRLEALIDTGATYCIVPPSIARVLGFRSSDRIRTERTNFVGSQVEMDVHRLESLRAGSAKAWNVMFAVYDAIPRARNMLVGLSFISKFRTTFDFDEGSVTFRSRTRPAR